ncbi:MAG TPA: hypothetical protein PKC35_17895 [Leptospiraceae bacterium]|nr:hypothetical protein [Leptospiraceae bacterium]
MRNISSAIILLAASALRADNLDLAVQEYRSSLPERARYHLAVASRALAPGQIATAQKLEGLLFLSRGDLPNAEISFRNSLNRKPDAFLFYVLGRMMLDLRRYDEAADYYEKALKNSTDQKADSKTDSTRVDLLPFHCAETSDSSSWSAMFADQTRFSQIWDASLSRMERMAAASQAGLIRKQYMKLKYSPPAGFVKEMPILSKYLLNPSPSTFADCHNSLDKRENALTGSLKKGSSLQSQEPLRQIQMRREIFLRNHVWALPSEDSYDFAARYLRAHDHRVESLHAFRGLFRLRIRKLWVVDEHESVESRMLVFAATMRDMAALYGLLGRLADRSVLDQMADAIESVRPVTPAQAEGLKATLFKIAGQNLRNREALEVLFLVDSPKSDFYRHKIEERDTILSDSELLEVFGPMYNPFP